MNSFEKIRKTARKKWAALESSRIPVIFLGTASCGRAAGAMSVLEAVEKTLKENKLKARIIQVGCIGPCYLEPLMDITLPGRPRVSYANVNAAKAKRIIQSYLMEGDPQLNYAAGYFGDEDPGFSNGLPKFFDLPMLKPQTRVVLRNCGFIDPEDIDHYLAKDGYLGLMTAFEKGPEAIIGEAREAGIRGRGGAGFPTFKKWEICRAVKAEEKYLICNADEGDPGAFMNRSLVEGDPHAVLEGLLIAAFGIGATHGYIYIRAEYPLAIVRLKKALDQMRAYGFLGKNIMGSGFDFEITIKEGAGAFVCGEETALIASVEGKRGMPRSRPPYPAIAGLNGKPTIINNVETLGTLPSILRNGSEWYRQYGIQGNYGTKTFSLVGKVRRTGLIEVPLGTTLRKIIFDIGGGTNKPFKAVQTGGPSGGCLSEEFLIKQGHGVTIFEALHKMGGVLIYGIPEFRLPKAIVSREVEYLRRLGVETITDYVVGKTRTLHSLLDEYDAVFVGSGAGLPWFMDVPGENLNGVYSANEYLTRMNLMKGFLFPEYKTPIKEHKRVAVVGGGNVAMDCARTALRLGADSRIIYRRSRQELPARLEEVENAEEEGVVFEFLTLPTRYIGDENGWIREMEVLKMELGEPDASGRRRPVPIKGSETIYPVDAVVCAIGNSPNPLILATTPGLEAGKKGNIVADEETGRTSIEQVWAGGDVVTGAATVILAMGAGRKAARSIGEYLTAK